MSLDNWINVIPSSLIRLHPMWENKNRINFLKKVVELCFARITETKFYWIDFIVWFIYSFLYLKKPFSASKSALY